jgi:two-component system chemotaxis response regulator CheB
MSVRVNSYSHVEPFRIIVVDDSASIRKAMSSLLECQPDFRVVGSAVDGQHALRLVAHQALKGHAAEIILLDIEMPVMDGLTALPQLLTIEPAPKIIMASTLTKRGASASLRALTLGASDYLCKPSVAADFQGSSFAKEVVEKVRIWGNAARKQVQTIDQHAFAKVPTNASSNSGAIATRNQFATAGKATSETRQALSSINPNELTTRPYRSVNIPINHHDVKIGNKTRPYNEVREKPKQTGIRSSLMEQSAAVNSASADMRSGSISGEDILCQRGVPSAKIRKACQRDKKISALAIGGSTGAPQALHKILSSLRELRSVPIFITQHMPPAFTTIFAEQIAKSSEKPCAEAQNGQLVQSDSIYVAPGDYHMIITYDGGKPVLAVNQAPAENFCRPAVDPMFRSLADVYGSGLLAVVLTGMGHDGLKGCEAIASKNGTIIVQDENSSIVWGMPGSVAKAGLANAILPLDEIASSILSIIGVRK